MKNGIITSFISILGMIGSSVPLHAEILVELFTSRACSVCDDAVQQLRTLENLNGVSTLAFHVDYFDYLGEPDVLASPMHGVRHAGYQKGETKELSTPEFVVNGRSGIAPEQLGRKIADDQAFRDERIEPMLVRAGDGGIQLSLRPRIGVAGDFQIVMATLYSQRELNELHVNREPDVASYSIVRSIENIGEWNGHERKEITVELDGAHAVVVIVQENGLGEVVSAKRVDAALIKNSQRIQLMP